MFRLISDSQSQPSVLHLTERCNLSDILFQLAHGYTTGDFGIEFQDRCPKIRIKAEINAKATLIEMQFYNHKGATYFALSVGAFADKASYNLKEKWPFQYPPRIERYKKIQVYLGFNGRLETGEFTQLSFGEIRAISQQVYIYASTTDMGNCRPILFVLDLQHPIPQFHCYIGSDTESA